MEFEPTEFFEKDKEGELHSCSQNNERGANCEESEKSALDQNEEFDYDTFVRFLKRPECAGYVGSIRRFISQFRRRAALGTLVTDQVAFYQGFCERLFQSLTELSDLSSFLMREGIEYLLTNQIYQAALFPPREAGLEDLERSKMLSEKIRLYGSWLQPRHLDLDKGLLTEDGELLETIEISLRNAQREWLMIGEYRTPRDKLLCLLNGCQLIISAIHCSSSADELVPLLIYALISTEVPHLHCHLQYIARYRHPRASSVSAYHFTSILAAASFIEEKLDLSTLVITEEEYKEQIAASQERIKHEDEANELARQQEAEQIPIIQRSQQLIRDSDLEKAGRVLGAVKEKLRVGAARSMDYLGKFLDEAETAIRSTIGSDNEETTRKEALQAEDEFQMQLAMALSLSELEVKQHEKPVDMNCERRDCLIEESKESPA